MIRIIQICRGESKHAKAIIVYFKSDRAGNVLQGRDSVARYSYGEGNRIASILYGSGVNVQYGYDGDGHMTSLRARSQEGQDLMRHTYSYDNNGNQVAKMEQHQLTLYGYDRLNRLLEVDYGSGAQESFSYDRAGNRIRRVLDGQTTSYTYDSRNRLLTLLEEDSRQTEFEYDRQGNMVSERSGSGTTTYSYDAFNRTAKVEKPDGSHIRHFYDPEGLRSGLRENGVTSRFVYDGWNMVNELDGDHNVKASYVRGHEWLAQVDGRGDSYYYLNNQHGDVAHITNRLGGIVNSYEYDAFGRTLSATEGIPNRFRYAGEQFDHTTEQYYLRARFYNPVIARFTQEDEYRGDGLNLYAYVGNNPINYVDPSGYSSQSCGGGGKKEGPFEGSGKLSSPKPIKFEPSFKQEEIALKTYEKLRRTGLDMQEIEAFARNTGLSVEEAIKLKSHVILTEHINLVDHKNGQYYYKGYFDQI